MELVRGETIGHGSFSTVSVARPRSGSTRFPPLMAVKTSNSFGAASLCSEKQVLDQLGSCPEIVTCFGCDRSFENGEELHHLLLEYAPRGSLAKLVKKSGGTAGLPESDVRRYTRSVVKGLSHIHSKGFAHCDIKLENILLFQNGDAKIADFGLARKTEDEQSKAEQNQSGEKARKFEIRGTPLYMAPETVNDAEFESPADIWALGCCVVEMASGKSAWSHEEGSNFMSLLMRIAVGDESPRIPEELSEQGIDFLEKCFVRDRNTRWTAEMLLRHPFVAVDYDGDDEEKGEEFPDLSPRSPFEFPDWISVSSDLLIQTSPSDTPVTSWLSPPEERIRGLVTEQRPDWSVTESWITVR